MEIIYKQSFINSLTAVSWYVESLNTLGSGDRWAEKVINEIEKNAQRKVEFAKCRNATLAKLSFRCFNFNDWVITYKRQGDKFVIHHLIHGSRLA